MKIFKGLPTDYVFVNPVVTVGMYDGVHLAHKIILQRVCRLAKEISGESILITFDPHPRSILYPEDKIEMLTSMDEKIELLETIGIDILIILPFTLEFSKVSSSDFVKSIMVDGIRARKIVVGYNHFYGHNREGNFQLLSKMALTYGFEVEEIPEQDIQNESISSSKIRKALAEGDIMKANAYLDYDYLFNASIELGNTIFETYFHRGWVVEVDFENKLIPAAGLYYVHVLDENSTEKGVLWIECGLKNNLQLFVVDPVSKQKREVAIVLKHMVLACNQNTSAAKIQKTMEALLFKANL